MRPGGIRENGLTKVWTAMTNRVARLAGDLGRDVADHPLRDDWWQSLYLAADGALSTSSPDSSGQITFDARRNAASFAYVTPRDIELTGPMAVRLWAEVDGADDVDFYVGVEKWRNHRYVPFEGSFGFGQDRITTGWQKASLRQLDPRLSPFTGDPTGQRNCMCR